MLPPSPRRSAIHPLVALAFISPLALGGCDTGAARPAVAQGELAGTAGLAGTSPVPSASASPAVSAAATFSYGPDLINARAQHTLTLLDDGRVLVVGGADGTGTLAESEVYDPLTSTWQRTRDLNPSGSMLDATGRFPTARQLHSATLLPDGRVLIAGGIGVERLDAEGQPVFEVLRSAYTFDPRTNAFAAAPPLPSARAWQLDAPTATGAVLVGGVDSTLASTTGVLSFDAARNRWSTSTLASTHTWGALATLPGRGALAVGGGDVQQGANGKLGVASAAATRSELLDASGVVSALAPTATETIFSAAAPLAGGGAFLSGGQLLAGSQFHVTDTTEVFDGRAWSEGPALLAPRYQHRALALRSGDVLLVGGVDAQAQPMAACELYQAKARRVIPSARLSIPRVDHRAVQLASGQVLVVGGFDAQGQAVAQTELYTP
ncbi:MAG: kelch repeat-containing protein [Planctomycetota bacterium]